MDVAEIDPEAVLRLAERLGAEEAEVFYAESRSLEIESKKEEISLARESRGGGVGVRVVLGGAVGFAATNNPFKVREAVETALASARVRPQDARWKSLPLPRKTPGVRGVFDRETVEVPVERMVEFVLELLGGVTEAGASPSQASISSGCYRTVILNSHGLDVSWEESLFKVSVEALAERGGETSTAYDFEVSRNLKVDLSGVGSRAGSLARDSLGGGRIESQETSVLLSPLAVADLLENAFLPGINAENVQKNRSPLKLGVQLAGEDLTIRDNGMLEGGIGTAPADDEGTPSRCTTILERGTLKSFLHDSYTAGQENLESTGNALRSSYSQLPSISPHNLEILSPTCDVLEETERGVMVHTLIGAHTANPVSGEFSVEARNCFQIEKGEPVKPIRSVMLTGNIYEMLGKIKAGGRDTRKIGGIVTPTLLVGEMKVLGT